MTMSHDPLAPSPMTSAARADPVAMRAETDYEAICAAVMETTRGRWFLAEYARRNRNADTIAVLAAIERIEAAIRGKPVAPSGDRLRFELAELAQAIARIKTEIDAINGNGQQPHAGTADKPIAALAGTVQDANADLTAAAENIQDAAWTLRERNGDAPLRQQLEATAGEVLAAAARDDLTLKRSEKAAKLLHYLEGRINALMAANGAAGGAMLTGDGHDVATDYSKADAAPMPDAPTFEAPTDSGQTVIAHVSFGARAVPKPTAMKATIAETPIEFAAPREPGPVPAPAVAAIAVNPPKDTTEPNEFGAEVAASGDNLATEPPPRNAKYSASKQALPSPSFPAASTASPAAAAAEQPSEPAPVPNPFESMPPPSASADDAVSAPDISADYGPAALEPVDFLFESLPLPGETLLPAGPAEVPAAVLPLPEAEPASFAKPGGESSLSPAEAALAQGFGALRAAVAAARSEPTAEHTQDVPETVQEKAATADPPATAAAPKKKTSAELLDAFENLAADLFEQEPAGAAPATPAQTAEQTAPAAAQPASHASNHAPSRSAQAQRGADDPLAPVMALSEEEKIALFS